MSRPKRKGELETSSSSCRRILEFLFTAGIGFWFGVLFSPHIGFMREEAGAVGSKLSSLSSADKGGTLRAIETNGFLQTSIAHEFKYDTDLIESAESSPRQRPRLLFMCAVYTFDQFLYLQKILDAMRDHCNAGWNVTVHLQVANGLTYSHPRYIEIQDRAYCYDIGQYIPIILDTYGKIGFGLNSKHRAYVLEHLEDFDYFSYAEEDMLLTVSHLRAVIEGE